MAPASTPVPAMGNGLLRISRKTQPDGGGPFPVPKECDNHALSHSFGKRRPWPRGLNFSEDFFVTAPLRGGVQGVGGGGDAILAGRQHELIVGV